MTTCPQSLEKCGEGCPSMLDCIRQQPYGSMPDTLPGVLAGQPTTELAMAEAPMARILRSFKAASKPVTIHTMDKGVIEGEIHSVEDGLVSLLNGEQVFHVDISLIVVTQAPRDGLGD